MRKNGELKIDISQSRQEMKPGWRSCRPPLWRLSLRWFRSAWWMAPLPSRGPSGDASWPASACARPVRLIDSASTPTLLRPDSWRAGDAPAASASCRSGPSPDNQSIVDRNGGRFLQVAPNLLQAPQVLFVIGDKPLQIFLLSKQPVLIHFRALFKLLQHLHVAAFQVNLCVEAGKVREGNP